MATQIRGFDIRRGRGFENKIKAFLQDLGVEYEFETLKLKYTIPASLHTYTPDFILPNGIIVETKGRFLSDDRKKHLLIRKEYPHLDIRFVFDKKNNKIAPGSKTTNEQWCEKNNFKYSIGYIPNSWLEEQGDL